MSVNIESLIFNPPFPCVMAKEERDVVNSFLLKGLPGETVTIPTAYVEYNREGFERLTKIGLPKRVGNFLAPAFISSVAILTSANIPMTSTSALLTGVLAVTGIAGIAHNEAWIRAKNVEDTKEGLFRHIEYFYQQETKNILTHAANTNFVNLFNEKVQQGGKLTLAELGQLVNVDTGYFRHACEELATTVLSAKAVLAMQDGKIEPYRIENSKDRGFTEGQHSDLILLKLKQQYEQQTEIVSKDETFFSPDWENEDTTPKTPLSLSSVFGKVANFYTSGFSKIFNSIFGKSPKAENYFPPVVTTFKTPEIEKTPDLGNRIRRYGIESLDLPALHPHAFQ